VIHITTEVNKKLRELDVVTLTVDDDGIERKMSGRIMKIEYGIDSEYFLAVRMVIRMTDGGGLWCATCPITMKGLW